MDRSARPLRRLARRKSRFSYRTIPGLLDSAGITREMRASIRVLVVDDDRTLREGCASVLQVEGYNVTAVGRGDEALETGSPIAFRHRARAIST